MTKKVSKRWQKNGIFVIADNHEIPYKKTFRRKTPVIFDKNWVEKLILQKEREVGTVIAKY